MNENGSRRSSEAESTRRKTRSTRAAAVIVIAVTMVVAFLAYAGLTAASPAPHGPAGLPTLRETSAPPTSVGPSRAVTAPASPSAYPSLPSPPATPRLGDFTLPGPHPHAFGPSGVPPGAEAILPRSPTPSTTAGSSTPPWQNNHCEGLWPGGPADWAQYYYEGNCYGHDEPNINFYSNLPGSGGNVTWNVQLPIDRSATGNQSNLYAAIWLGMSLSDPLGWLDSCFLELQFYPDQSWYNPSPSDPNQTVNGEWIAAAVAWQIESATGFEDPCFYEPAYLHGVPGPAFLNMTQGDKIQVTMTGWQNNPNGENITIADLTNGQTSSFTLWDYTGNYPLNPIYSTETYPGAFPWTPGGEEPVSFAFETGHAGNGEWPANNSYGGCSGGAKSTPVDPGAPCPSYDPGQWANDTAQPWHIDSPTFFNAHAHQQAVQIGFGQPEGGINLVDQTSNGVCSGLEGSSWCSYPWYSYYCAAQTFEFGALDYPGVSGDFGKYTQFPGTTVTSPNGIGNFMPKNFSMPACGAATYTVTVAGAAGMGSAYFLSRDYVAAGSVGGLIVGDYSLNAIALPGESFSHWSTTGGVSVAVSTSPWTTLHVAGSGGATAVFTTTPSTTSVTFKDKPGGKVGLSVGYFLTGNGAGLATVANGGSHALAPGVYALEAYPKVGYIFTSWSVSGSGVVVAGPQSESTWLFVLGTATTATVTAHYAASTLMANVYVYAIGVGTVKLGSLTVTNSNPNTYNVALMTYAVGTYALTESPGAGTIPSATLTEYFFPVFVFTNFSLSTHVAMQNGTSALEVFFTSGAAVTLRDAPSHGGVFDVASATGTETVSGGTTLTLAYGTYQLTARPNHGFSFVDWTSSTSGVTFLTTTSDAVVLVSVAGNAVVTAHYSVTSTNDDLKFATFPKDTGAIEFNSKAVYANGHITDVTPGQYVVQALPAPGWSFDGWAITSHVTVLAAGPGIALIDVTGPGTVRAHFVQDVFAVTFIAYLPTGVTPSTATLTVDGHTVSTGMNLYLSYGYHTIHLKNAGGHTVTWTTDAGTLSSTTGASVTVFVSSAGTVYAIL